MVNIIKIRPIKLEDASKLVELMKIADYRPEEWSQPKIRKYLKKEGHVILVAHQGKKLVGYLGLKEVENEDSRIRALLGTRVDIFGCAEWMAVHPKQRGRGIASSLLKAAEGWMKRHKRKGVWLDCRKSVMPLYEKNRYVLAGTYRGTSKSGLSVLKYVLVKEF